MKGVEMSWVSDLDVAAGGYRREGSVEKRRDEEEEVEAARERWRRWRQRWQIMGARLFVIGRSLV